MIVLCVWALRSAEHAIQALSLSVVIKFLNPALYPQLGTASLLGWGVLGLAGLRIGVAALQTKTPRNPVLLWVLIFSLVILAHSMIVSRDSMVSSFKILAFAFGATTVLLGFKVSAARDVNWIPWFTGLWTTILLLSLPTVFVASIGYQVNGKGFQGILSQPQTLGTLLAPVAAWFAARLMFFPLRETHWVVVGIALLSWIFLLLSGARTGLVAVLGGLVCVIVLSLLTRREWRSQVASSLRRPIVLLAMFMFVSAMILFSSSIEEGAKQFLFKYGKGQGTSSGEAITSSRGAGIDSEWKNFLASPWVGHGFGITPLVSPDSTRVLDPFFGLPLSAPTEKGFLPTAILEETGILGTLCLILLLGSLIWQVSRKSDIATTWIFFTSILVNVGEMVFFSFGGLGLYIWLIMGWATSSRWRKLDEA
ncbi:MAG: O-antigen ligase family protein [Nitrospirae bacterium]|nr:O-antigen ligase family protein [Nitrospirota bacterium]MDE3040393.1 O-antigen ligase family protein [Nitrospirota bacterium]